MFRFLLSVLLIVSSLVGFAQADIPAILESNKNALGLSAGDLAEYRISNVYTTQHLGITHVYLEQRYQDIPVFNGILNLNLKADLLLSFGNRWIPELDTKVPSHLPEITAGSAVERSAEHLGHSITAPEEINKEQNKNNQVTKVIFAPGHLSREEISAELVWLKDDRKNILLCWEVVIAETETENIWDIFIDAHSGEFIRQENQVMHCVFDHTLPAHRGIKQSGAELIPVEHFMSLSSDSSYNVFAMPVESPNHGSRTIVNRPWTSAGSGNPAISLGWHNNGSTNYTSTRGNNVHAYEDINHDNAPGFSPDTFNLRFDYPFTPSIDPTDNLAACITNLFYWNNIIHDVMYQYGFDEVSGNFQNNNLGRGGNGNDYVLAEAQDGGGTNNANFSTPADGSKPRMQMYIWSPVSETSPLTINTPANIAGTMLAIESAFSTNNKLADIGLTTGDLILVDDTGGLTHEACGTISNSGDLAGKIAVIDRGNCDFVVKVKKVQDFGAIAAIVINNVTGSPFAMSGADNTIVIPAVMISLEDGDLLKAVMDTATVNSDLDAVDQITPDGDFDSGIVTHEYGHGISTRLTGGPSIVNCLYNEEQMGEGWSDYFGLMLTTDWPSASATDPRGIGTYVLGQSVEGTGIRTYPYTIDTDVNPFTYADVATAPVYSGIPSVHYIGSIWCTVLWDMTWNIIEMEGVDADMYHGTGGNNIALQLVIDGLKLQPCSPGFVDGRDAILLADEINYGGAHRCAIWDAFAGRGLGVDASQGSSDDNTDGVVSFAMPAGIRIESAANVSEAGEGQEVTVTLKTTCGCEGQGNLNIEDVLSDDLVYVPGSGGTLNGNTVSFTADTLAALDSLEFIYRAFVSPCSATETVDLSTENAESTAQYVSVKLSGTGTKAWVKSTAQAASPTHSWYAKDYTSLADFALTLINPVMADAGPVEIGFNHRYNTEANYDGGVVEYSVNGGTTWLDAGPWFTENGYPATINTSGTDSPIAGRAAFTGNSDSQFNTTGFVHSTLQLSFYGSESMLLRFRFVCDAGVGGTGINGWYVDDITIKQPSGLVNKTIVNADGGFSDSLTYSLRTSVFSGSILYVDQGSTGVLNGGSWADAMHELSMALAIAGCRSADSVFLAEGTYLPGLTNDRSLSFHLPDSTSLFGGFPAGGSAFAQRDPVNNASVLSGNIGNQEDNADNTYHVVKIDSAQLEVLLDGVTLSHGNANGVGDNHHGAAVLCLGGLTLQNVVISDNSGLTAGQLVRIRNAAAHLQLINCTLHGTNDGIPELLNTNSGQVTIEGATLILEE